MENCADFSALRFKQIGDRFFVSSFYGAWDVLSREEHEQLMSKKPLKSLLDRLESKCVLLSEGNEQAVREKIRARYDFLCQPPMLHVVAATNRCDRDCVYCRAKKDDADMDEKTAKAVADFVLSSSSHLLTIEFQGGESLLNYPVVEYVIDYVNGRKNDRVINYRMVTNLSQMTEDIFGSLMDRRVHIATSLDGPRKLHDSQRGAGSYEQVAYWMKYARDRTYPISAMPTITRKSLSYGRSIVDEYVKQSIPVVTLRPVACLGKAAGREDLCFSVGEYMGFWSDALGYCMKRWSGGVDIKEGATVSFLERLLLDSSSNMCMRSPCGAGISQLAYDPNGDIFLCDSARGVPEFMVGSVHALGFEDVVKKTSHLRGINNLTTLCDSCGFSPFCGTCIVQAFGIDASPVSIKPREFLCRLNHEQLAVILKELGGRNRKVLLEWLASSFPERLYAPQDLYSKKSK